MPGLESTLSTSVVVLARDPETIDGLAEYLRSRGARLQLHRELEVPEGAGVIVMFGDEFDSASARRFIADWRETKRGRLALILVTAHATLGRDLAGDQNATVLARPVWGWVLMSAIRSVLRQTSQPDDPSHESRS
jgi:hypothetical protein